MGNEGPSKAGSNDDYSIRSMEFKGADSAGNHDYLLSLNKSLQHTGRINDIEDGLNKHTRIEELRTRIEGFKADTLKKLQRVQMESVRASEYAATIGALNNVLEFIEQIDQ